MNKFTAMITPFMVNRTVIVYSCACWRASWVIISTRLCTPLVQFSYRQCNHRIVCALSLKDKFESWLKDLLEACTLTSKRSQLTGGRSLAHYNITMRSCLTLSIPKLSRGYVHNTEKLHHVDSHSTAHVFCKRTTEPILSLHEATFNDGRQGGFEGDRRAISLV